MSQDAFQSYANQAADNYNIPRQIFNALISVESGWNSAAYSSKGAIGLTQLMPGTATELGADPWNPASNLFGGAKYLSQQYAKFGNWSDALAAYNAGPGNIQAGKGYAATVLEKAGYVGTSGGPIGVFGMPQANTSGAIVTPGGNAGAANPFDNAGAAQSKSWLDQLWSDTQASFSRSPLQVANDIAGGAKADIVNGIVSSNTVMYVIGGVIVIALIMVGVSGLTRGGK